MKLRPYFYESYSVSLTVLNFNCNKHLLYYTVEYESSLLSTGPSWSWDHEWRVTLGPRTRSDLSPAKCLNAIHIYSTVGYKVRLNITGPSWSWDHEWRVTLGPRARSDPSPVILWPNGHTPFWYDAYIQWRMKVKAFLSFIVSLIYGDACTLHTFSTVEYKLRLISTGPSWSRDHEGGSLQVLGPGVTIHRWS